MRDLPAVLPELLDMNQFLNMTLHAQEGSNLLLAENNTAKELMSCSIIKNECEYGSAPIVQQGKNVFIKMLSYVQKTGDEFFIFLKKDGKDELFGKTLSLSHAWIGLLDAATATGEGLGRFKTIADAADLVATTTAKLQDHNDIEWSYTGLNTTKQKIGTFMLLELFREIQKRNSDNPEAENFCLYNEIGLPVFAFRGSSDGWQKDPDFHYSNEKINFVTYNTVPELFMAEFAFKDYFSGHETIQFANYINQLFADVKSSHQCSDVFKCPIFVSPLVYTWGPQPL